MNIDKTLIITSDKQASTLFFIDNDKVRWKVTVTDNDNLIQIYKGRDNQKDDNPSEENFISIAEAFGSKLLHSNAKWTAAEIKDTCPGWKSYTIILCTDGNISLSGPREDDATKAEE